MDNSTTYIRTGRPEFDNLFPMVKSFLEKDVLEMEIDGLHYYVHKLPIESVLDFITVKLY